MVTVKEIIEALSDRERQIESLLEKNHSLVCECTKLKHKITSMEEAASEPPKSARVSMDDQLKHPLNHISDKGVLVLRHCISCDKPTQPTSCDLCGWPHK